jgi:uncharacterized damage-inducible protein DinB
MERRVIIVTLAAFVGAATIASAQTPAPAQYPPTPPTQAPAQPPPPKPSTGADRTYTEEVGQTFGYVTGVILKSAEKMPEDQFGFKPTPEVRSYGQILGHIANANYRMCGMAAGEKPNETDFEKTTAKADLVKALTDAFAYCNKVTSAMTDSAGTEKVKWFVGDRTKLGVLNFNVAHNLEHYGNLVTYMRLKGIVPPTSERQSQ